MSTDSSTVTYREIPDFPGYRIGDDGSVWSRRKRGSYAKGMHTDWTRMTPSADVRGYSRVYLYRNSGQRNAVRWQTHALVLTAFVGPRPDGMEACHEDGDPTNNALSNLRWDTQQGNWRDRIRHGHDCRGEKNKKAKLTVHAVRYIRAHADIATRRELAAKFGVTRQLVALVIQRKCWAWLD